MAITQVTYIDSELELASLESARFSWAGGDYRGRPLLGPDLAERLLALEDEHEAYGLALYEAVFPANSELREGLREAVLTAEREKSRLRFRLHLVPDLPAWAHALYWELLADSDRRLAFARSPDTAFSRYLDVRRVIGGPANERPRLLCVVSAPSDVVRYGMAEIRRAEVLRCLQASVAPLADAVEVAFLEPPSTLARLRERLMENGGFQLLHFYGHGRNLNGDSALVLEDDQGQAHFVEEELLAEVFLGVRELRLVTLVACHGGAPSSGDPFSGLAGRLVQRGLPAVIAMRRAVRVGSAHLFTQHFYRQLAQTGRADAAVNEARQQLYLARPQTIDWSSPVLYSRLADGRLWLPREEPSEPAQPIAPTRPRHPTLLRRLRPLQWLTALLAPALFLLGLWPAARSELRLDLHATRIAVWLAQCVTTIEDLNLVEIAAVPFDTSPLPSPFPPSIPSAQTRVSPRNVGSRVPIYMSPMPASPKAPLDDQAEDTRRFTVADLDQANLRATSQRNVRQTFLDTSDPFRLSRIDVLFPVSEDVAEETRISTHISIDNSDILGSSPAGNRADLYQHAEKAERLIARISAPDTEGAGILFAVDDCYVYGITSKHVLFQQGKIVEGLEAELRAWPGRRLPIVGYKLHHEEDLAAFWADLSSLNLSRRQALQGIPLNQLGTSSELKPGDTLWSLGHSLAGSWILPQKSISFARKEGDNIFTFESSCPRGHSGGGVFDKQWQLVGMMIDEDHPFCRALRIEPVLKIVKGWKLNIGLTTPQTQKPAPQKIKVAVVDFDNRSDKDLPNLGFVARYITASSLHTLPGIVLVTRDRLSSVPGETVLPDTLETNEGITRVGHLLQADVLVTGSILRYDVERRTLTGSGTNALQDVSSMSINLQIFDVKTARVKYSKKFDVERTKQYIEAISIPSKPIDLTNELLEDFLTQAQSDIQSTLLQLTGELEAAGQIIDVPVCSTPAGADVALDGNYIGKTPITLQLTSEIHEIQVVLPRYVPLIRHYTIEPGLSIKVNLELISH